MSEGIQEQKKRQIQGLPHSNSSQENHLGTTEQPQTSESSSVSSAPRAGALLVEAYRKLERKTQSLSPSKILLEYSKSLIKLIGDRDQSQTVKEAQALLSIVKLASRENLALVWDPDTSEAIASILQSHPSLQADPHLKDTVSQLTGRKVATESFQMDPTPQNDAMTSLISDIAGRMSLSDESSSGLTRIISELGPSCTLTPATFREVVADVSRTNGPMTESAIANLTYFFSDKSYSNESASSGMSSTLLMSIVMRRGQESGSDGWNLDVVAQVLSEDYGSRDWMLVASSWDFPSFKMRNTSQFRALLELFRSGAKRNPPLSVFTKQWHNSAGQLSVLECIMAVPSSVYTIPLDEGESADAATAPPPGPNTETNPRCWASMEILQRLLHLSDLPSLYRRVRDLFVQCLLTCPEVLLCSLVRLQLRAANAQRDAGSDTSANAGMQIKTELMRELIPLFFRPNSHHRVQNGAAALRRLYTISPTTVMAACFEAWRSTAQDGPQVRLAAIIHIINIARLLPSPADAVASLLSGSRDAEYSIAVAFVMADNDYLQLKPWLAEKLSSKASVGTFPFALTSYIRKTYATAAPRGSGIEGMGVPLVSIENMATSLQLLQSLDPAILSQPMPGMDNRSTLGDGVRSLVELCLLTHPSLRSSISSQPPPTPSAGPSSGPGPGTASDDVEEMATAYFQKIYTSEQSIGEVVEMLKRFKTSGDARENEIFACMVHNLFDEYRFFARYPEKELRITGILFGALIQEQLVSSITLGIALRYVLEALRKPPSPPGVTTNSGKMFKFGMFALEQFKGRLHEWPQYCSHIVQIPHLREGYAQLVSEIEHEMARNQSRSAGATAAQPSTTPSPVPAAGYPSGGDVSSQTSVGSTPDGIADNSQSAVSPRPATVPVDVKPRVAEFGPRLGRAVTEAADEEREFDAPPASVLDRVQFLVNNLAPSNVEQKAAELRQLLDPTYFGWLGHFLVVKRISTQANFHGLYLSFLDNLGDFGIGLVEAIVNSVYHNIGKLLRSPKITTSSSERSYLKNLGIWLGQITLARNRPILQVMLDCKELLLQGYETGKLIAVAPFLAKTLEGAKHSVIFRPPNPWIMSLLGVFRSVYDVEGLKMNIKFEVEVLCKNLGIKLEDIALKSSILAKRIAPVKEVNPDFNIKVAPPQKAPSSSAQPRAVAASQALGQSSGGEDSGRTTPVGTDQQETVIPNLAAYVTVNQSLPQILQSQTLLPNLTPASLKRYVPVAVDRAIREIIQPVVERSVTIACITTKEIVTKDFAMESEESKMRKAGQLMVANLAGSLALVTCREPLRSSISTNLRQLLTTSLGRPEKPGEQEQNLIEQCVQICATDNLELGCRLIEKAATEKAVRDVDEALAGAMNARRKHREQTGQPFYDMSIFSNGNQRYPAALPDQLRPKPGGLRSEHFQLYESFQRISRQGQGPGSTTGQNAGSSTPRAPGTPGSAGEEGETNAGSKARGQFGSEMLAQLAGKVDAAVTAVLAAAGTKVTLAMLPPEHQIMRLLAAFKQVMPNANSNGSVSRPMTASEQELVLGFSQGIFKRLYELNLSEPLRLEALVAILENIDIYCPKLGKDMGTWATYAPTNTEPQRRLHKTVLLLLVRSRLLSVHDLDSFLAARADQGRNHIWLEFSLFFISTAFTEKISSPSDFPKLMDLMTRITEGRSQANMQVVQAYRKRILLMLEETRSGPSNRDLEMKQNSSFSELSLDDVSSLSAASRSSLAIGPPKVAEANDAFMEKDPASARQQATELLVAWIRLQSDPIGNEKLVVQYLQALQQIGVGKTEEQTERFFRLSTLVVVDAVQKSATHDAEGSRSSLNYTFIDMYSRLLKILFHHMNSGGTQEKVDAQRLGVLNKILGVSVRAMMWQYEKSRADNVGGWDQRPWYRLFMNLLMDLLKPEPAFESIRLGVMSVFGVTLHMCQPLVVPGFAFAWLELVSHRHFLPNLLLFQGEEAWHIAHQLLIDLFLFLEPHLRRIELTPAIKKMYEGTLRVMLVLLHDFPSFLASYHLSFCSVIPDNCVQLRNIVLSATPQSMSPPDPFTPNLKIDLLPEISQSPVILSNVLGPIEGFRSHLDAFLKEGQRRNFLSSLLPLVSKEGTAEVHSGKVNSLILYVGAHALARIQSPQISLSRTPEIEIFMKLMDLDDKGRYACLNGIANQLRYPSSHTHYFSCVMLYLFSETKNVAVKEQVTRVLLERLIVNRPHPWGVLITFIELIKNKRYGFWTFPFTRCATEIEKVFESVARSCMPPGGQQRSTLVGGEEQ